MKPTVTGPNYEIYLGDCRDILPHLPKCDLLLTDPPYGIGESDKKQKTRGSMTKFKNGKSKWVEPKDYGENNWDKVLIDAETMDLARSKALHQIIFGGNYYQLPPTSCWLVWDKQNSGDFADCELAWTNLPKAVRIIHHRWNGMLRLGNEPRYHPTAKPLGVMAWALSHAPANVETVLDPFMGSGTTGVACIQSGRRFIGIERDPDYFEIARQRLEAATGIFAPRTFGGLFAEETS